MAIARVRFGPQFSRGSPGSNQKFNQRSPTRRRSPVPVSPALLIKPATPSSDAFWNLSSAYRDAADAAYALTRAEDYTGLIVVPCVFLYFRCIELSLKSVLIYEGVPEREIAQTLGHRLSALLARAEQFSKFTALDLFRNDRDIIHKFSDAYSDKWFEYPEDPPAAYPPFEKLKDLAHRVCDGIQTYEREKAQETFNE